MALSRWLDFCEVRQASYQGYPADGLERAGTLIRGGFSANPQEEKAVGPDRDAGQEEDDRNRKWRHYLNPLEHIE